MKSKKDIKVMFIMPKIGIGGIEHAWLKLIEELQKQDVNCHLAVAKKEGLLLKNAQAIVKTSFFSSKSIFYFINGLCKLLRHEKPTHVVTAFEDVGFLTWLSIKISNIDTIFIHSVHNTLYTETPPKDIFKKSRFILEKYLSKIFYKYTDKIVTVSNGLKDEIIEYFKINENKIHVIYNPVIPNDFKYIKKENVLDLNFFKITSIGRLHYQKGFDNLIRAVKYIQGSFILEIWGDGPEKNKLESLITSEKVEKKVFLKGYSNEPFETLQKSDIFVLSSRYEGLGNVLIEAMACQCQLISTDCKHGPIEILENGKFGQIVGKNNPKDIAIAINNIIDKKILFDHQSLIQRSSHFTVEVSTKKWIELIIES